MLDKGIIVSIQGYKDETTNELIENAINAGAVAIRTDKPVNCTVPIIGLQKTKVDALDIYPYITPDVRCVEYVSSWADYVAIDYRRINNNLDEIDDFVKDNGIKVVADIENTEDYNNIIEKGYTICYVATTFSIFKSKYKPDLNILRDIDIENLIAEGNYTLRKDVRTAFEYGANNVCIGGAISNIYKLTKKYTSILKEE